MDETSQKVVDPVCGMSVEVGSEAASVEHEGTTYYFCSQQCADTFTSNPEKYITP